MGRTRDIAEMLGKSEVENTENVSLFGGAGGGGGGVTTYADISTRDAAEATAGDLAFITSNSSYYGYNGTVWKRVYVGVDEPLTWDTEAPDSLKLEYDGSTSTITVAASDLEGFPVTYGYDVTPANQSQATITNDSSVFTFTPSTNDSDAGDFTLRIKAFDGLNTIYNTTAVSLIFSWEVDLDNVTYDNDSFDAGAQSTETQGISFSPDGTKMYLIGYTNPDAELWQYTLSTAWDITTASYDSISLKTTTQTGTQAFGFTFSRFGTKLYVVSNTNDTIYQYTLSTAWDISTASYDSVELSTWSAPGLSPTPYAIWINPDGDKMFILDSTYDSVFLITLSTPFDLSTASWDGAGFSVETQETYPYDVKFNPGGTKFYIVGGGGDSIYSYTLSTEFDITTASYDNKSYDLSAQNNVPWGFTFSDDGSKMYMLSRYGVVYQYSTGV